MKLPVLKKSKMGAVPFFFWPVCLLASILALLMLSISEPDQQQVETPIPPQLYSSAFQLIGTGNRLGTYYPAGCILTDWFNSHFAEKGGILKAVETNGSIDNVRLLKEKRLLLGMAESRIVKETCLGEASSTLRLVWPLWNDVVHIVLPPVGNKPFDEEFPGNRRGFPGQKNSSTYRTSCEIFAAFGFAAHKISLNLQPDMVFDSLTKDEIGFATIQAGMPNRTVSDALIFH
ncbi:MAG: hypothetical protein EOM80_16310, partial [Erysipelotrichia bacterium]|nr:hypothetical protein [Erysipelotrichia bacterium]